jgi:hypothetical protein
LIDWLRRLVGAGPARTAPPKIKVEPAVAVQRDRDELTSFISAAPTPEPVPEATVAVSLAPSGGAADSPASDSSDAAALDPSELPDTSPVGSETESGGGDSEATLMLEVPSQSDDSPGQEATLFFQVPRMVIGKLVAIKGELVGEEYELREGDNHIGRSPESDVVLASMWISRTHAVLRSEMGRTEIESLSDKITSVDGEPVAGAVALADGAKIQLGGTVCRLELEG